MLALREDLMLALTSGTRMRVFVKMHVRASQALYQHCVPRDSLSTRPPSLEKLGFVRCLSPGPIQVRAHKVMGWIVRECSQVSKPKGKWSPGAEEE